MLTREAGRIFPGALDRLDRWAPPWARIERDGSTGGGRVGADGPDTPRPPALGPPIGRAVLDRHPATAVAVAELLDRGGRWTAWPEPAADSGAAKLLQTHPATARAVADLLDHDES